MVDILDEMSDETPTQRVKHWSIPIVISIVMCAFTAGGAIYSTGKASAQIDQNTQQIKVLQDNSVPRSELQYVKEKVDDISADVKELRKQKR